MEKSWKLEIGSSLKIAWWDGATTSIPPNFTAKIGAIGLIFGRSRFLFHAVWEKGRCHGRRLSGIYKPSASLQINITRRLCHSFCLLLESTTGPNANHASDPPIMP